MSEKAVPYLKDGWHKWNPNKAKCDDCGSTNLEFHWCQECKICFKDIEEWLVRLDSALKGDTKT